MEGVTGAVTETFKYSGDGQRVVVMQGITSTVFIGNYFEWRGTLTDSVKYYYSAATRVAMRIGSGRAGVFDGRSPGQYERGGG